MRAVKRNGKNKRSKIGSHFYAAFPKRFFMTVNCCLYYIPRILFRF